MPMKRYLYPKNWPAIAGEVKARAGFKCTECGRHHNPRANYTLTVHHIDGNPGNNRPTNLIALCQRCHLPKHAGGIGEVPGQQRLFHAETEPALSAPNFRLCPRSATHMVSIPECEIHREEKFNLKDYKHCSTSCTTYRHYEKERNDGRSILAGTS